MSVIVCSHCFVRVRVCNQYFFCIIRSTNTIRRPNNDNRYYEDDFYPDDSPPAPRRERVRERPREREQVNPCQPKYHRVISNQPKRSYNYRFGSANSREHALCDRDLPPGWYRFQSLAGNTIPTSCPGTNYCGTRAPVWMKGIQINTIHYCYIMLYTNYCSRMYTSFSKSLHCKLNSIKCYLSVTYLIIFLKT